MEIFVQNCILEENRNFWPFIFWNENEFWNIDKNSKNKKKLVIKLLYCSSSNLLMFYFTSSTFFFPMVYTWFPLFFWPPIEDESTFVVKGDLVIKNLFSTSLLCQLSRILLFFFSEKNWRSYSGPNWVKNWGFSQNNVFLG